MSFSFPRLCLFLAAWPAAAGAVRGGESVSLRETDPGTYQVEGSFLVQAPRSAAWAVLTDYENIKSFVSSIESSRVVEPRVGGRLALEQKARGQAFFLSRRMRLLLAVQERPMDQILFEDRAHKDFDLYTGRWSINDAPGCLRIEYSLTAKPRFAAPHFLLRGGIRRSAQGLLTEVRREILRRAGTAPETGGPEARIGNAAWGNPPGERP